MGNKLFALILLMSVAGIVFASEVISADMPNAVNGKAKYAAMGQTSVDFLTFAIGLEKQTFILDEPIEVAFILTNNSDQKKRLAEPSSNVSLVNIKVTQIEGEKPIPVQPMFSMPGPSADFGWVFNPGDSKYSIANILDHYPNGIPTGRYSIQGIYEAPHFLSVDWYGAIRSEPVEFSIVNPATEQEMEARQIYVKTRKYASQRKTFTNAIGMFSIIQELGEVGLFNKYVEFHEASVYRELGNIDDYKIRILSYVSRYGNNDGDSILGLTSIGVIYRRDKKDFTEARRIFKLLPDGYSRANHLRICDTRESQQNELHRKTSESEATP